MEEVLGSIPRTALYVLDWIGRPRLGFPVYARLHLARREDRFVEDSHEQLTLATRSAGAYATAVSETPG